MRADQAADTELGEELEPPSSDDDVVAVSSVWEVEVEDGFNGLGRRSEDAVDTADGADVGSVGEGCEEFDALASKGSITFSA